MAYRLEFMHENIVVVPYKGDEVLTTVEAAVTIGVAMIATMDAVHGATWFRVLDEKGNVVAKGPEDGGPKYGPPESA